LFEKQLRTLQKKNKTLMTNHWLDKTEYPFAPNYFEVNGQQLHYIDEGQGQTILFVHGTPSWSFDFRHIIKALKSSFRCLAIDHIGFGLSSKPKDYDYSTQNHSKTLEKFISHKNLNHITLVVHDFGGPIGLNFALRFPEKVKNIVVLNSWLWDSTADKDFIKFSKILKNPFLPFLYRHFNFSAKYVLPASFGDHKISKQLLTQYTKPFTNKTQRNGTLAFAKSLLTDQVWFGQLWDKKEAIAAKPILFIWGMKDPVIKPHYLNKFISGFKQATVKQLDTCGHFPQEEQPELVTKIILDFLTENKTDNV